MGGRPLRDRWLNPLTSCLRTRSPDTALPASLPQYPRCISPTQTPTPTRRSPWRGRRPRTTSRCSSSPSSGSPATATRTCSTSRRCSSPPSTRSAPSPPSRRATDGPRRRPAAARRHALFNVAAVLHGGRVLGDRAEVVPAELPRVLREAAVQRGAPGDRRHGRARSAQTVPFGTDLLFAAADLAGPRRARVEICEDLWVPVPPSTFAALAGATCSPTSSGSNITIGKAGYRRELCSVAVGAHALGVRLRRRGLGRVDHRPRLGRARASIAENGNVLAESERFADGAAARHGRRRPRPARRRPHAADELRRLRSTTTRRRLRVPPRRLALDVAGRAGAAAPARAAVPLRAGGPGRARRALRGGVRDPGAAGSPTRLRATGIEQASCIGVSGGLDSTQALLVAVRSMDDLGLPRTQRPRRTPCRVRDERRARSPTRSADGTRSACTATRSTSARLRCRCCATSAIPAADGERRYDVTYENVQAGERTSLSSGSRTSTRPRASAPATCPSSRSAGAPTASATTCRTTG